MAAQRPVFFDGRQLRRLSPTEFLDDAVLSANVILADGTVSFSSTVAGIDPTLPADLSTRRYVDYAVTDASWHAPIEDALTTPPGGPSEGQRWLVAATATGAWAGQEDNIAVWRQASWVFLTPTEGWATFNRATNLYIRYDGAAWVTFSSVINHNNTTGLQGGQSAQYFHLTSAQHTGLTSSQAQRRFWATPSGATGVPTMRAMTLVDIPAGSDGQFLRTASGVPTWQDVTATDIGAVPTSRTITTNNGISGGGDLSANRTFSWDGLGVQREGTLIGTRRLLNIIGGRAVVADNGGSSRVDVTLPDPALMAMVFGG